MVATCDLSRRLPSGVSRSADRCAGSAPVSTSGRNPGRLVDLMKSGALRLDRVETLVLDEADRMLDMGFMPDVRYIIAKLPAARQTLLFSATMPGPIAELADRFLQHPARVAVTPVATTAERIDQRVLHLDRGAKLPTLIDFLRRHGGERVLVFTRTKRGADKVVRGMQQSGLAASAIHGNKSQNNRERALSGFRDGAIRTLVATDIAARGIDVDGISHVINFDLPNEPESYVHRIGRTARAGADGIAISYCSADEAPLLRAIEKLIRAAIPRAPGDKSRSSGTASRHAGPAQQRLSKHNGNRAPARHAGGEHAAGQERQKRSAWRSKRRRRSIAPSASYARAGSPAH
jgi:ATP-dependent RNA helicase RhlE